MRAGETGKLYGSVTTQMIADSLKEATGVEIDRRQIDAQPIRMIGEHEVSIRLTVDLIPVITILVFREGEAVEVVGEGEDMVVQEEEAEAEPDTSEPVAKVDVEKEQSIEVELEEEPTAVFEPEQEEENETVTETEDKE
jgi:large subunit ribosomal protein L9